MFSVLHGHQVGKNPFQILEGKTQEESYDKIVDSCVKVACLAIL